MPSPRWLVWGLISTVGVPLAGLAWAGDVRGQFAPPPVPPAAPPAATAPPTIPRGGIAPAYAPPVATAPSAVYVPPAPSAGPPLPGAAPASPVVAVPPGPVAPPSPTGLPSRSVFPTPAGMDPSSVPLPYTDMVAIGGTAIVARIGQEVILAGEVSDMIDAHIAKLGAKAPPAELQTYRIEMIRQRLSSMIDTKLVLSDLRRSIPEENVTKILAKLAVEFEAKEIPKLMEKHKAADRADLERKLQAVGSSLERERRFFSDKIMAQNWLRQQVKVQEDVTHEELLAWYQAHLADYDFPAKVRWEQVSVRISRYRSRAEAYAALAAMGNEILSGRPLAEVARAASDGPTAEKGGQQDWTSQGSLASTALDQALFQLPVGLMSPILEDDKYFHIVRVLERTEAGRTPFTEAQVGIRLKIREARFDQGVEELLTRLRESTLVWTVFDDQPAEQAASLFPLSTGLGGPR